MDSSFRVMSLTSLLLMVDLWMGVSWSFSEVFSNWQWFRIWFLMFRLAMSLFDETIRMIAFPPPHGFWSER